MKIYVYTIPKAGTYFLASLIESMGFTNTGFHVSRTSRLNTAKFDLNVNAKTPSATHETKNFLSTLAEVPKNGIAFGHFPVPLMGWMLHGYRFICSYRHPRKTLVSEFIDFRFRRTDVNWVSRAAIADDAEAFATYLEQHGPMHTTIFHQMLAARLLVHEPGLQGFSPQTQCFVNFDHVLADYKAIEPVRQMLNASSDLDLQALHQKALRAETKTKATDVSVDRSAFWSPRAEAAYQNLGLERIVARMQELGLQF